MIMFSYPKKYEVIIIGAGHAGIEAALAAARMNCETLLLSANLDTIGQMSCNPAIGGLAKGHLVREIDAIGGEMGKTTDLAGLQFRMLNTKKGPSVWAPRAQCDKKYYQLRMKLVCEQEQKLEVKQAQAVSILYEDGKAIGVRTDIGVQFCGTTVIVTTGTFLRGLMHIGSNTRTGGRSGDPAAMTISNSLAEMGLELGRLKTGTPPRLQRNSIDFSKTQAQHGDSPVPYFGHWNDELFHVEQHTHDGNSPKHRNAFKPGSILDRFGSQVPCYLTYTSGATERIIKSNLHRSPIYCGAIHGIGPRYCPSIEDKIVKFPDKERHQIFLEPEGIETDEIYVNGLSTCLPFENQVEVVKSVIGCEDAKIMRPAYAVEYDFVFPTQLRHTLETKCCKNLFLAGQINGTSGYEEAGAQGVMAGINAAMVVQGKEPIVLGRDQAYIGVLIDDLVTKGTSEPYRMFTSRAEYRLLLRQDNADLRLADIGHQIGLLPFRNYERFLKKKEAIRGEIERLERTRIGSTSLAHMLRRPEVSYRDLPGADDKLDREIVQQVEISIKYEGYIGRQTSEVEKFKATEEKTIPAWLDYESIPSLRTEAKQKLSRIRPETVGQASRISGVSPADISLVMVWMKRGLRAVSAPECSREKCPSNDVPDEC
jgi:tRNA uridine 5-carboxymethylaminomethyl modification enzyme